MIKAVPSSHSVLLIYLSGKNPAMARWEVIRLARRRGDRVKVFEGRIIGVETDDELFYTRLAYFKVMGHLWAILKGKKDISRLKESELPTYTLDNQPFVVRTFGKRSHTWEQRVGWWLEGEVNASSPKTVVGVILGKKVYVVAPARFPENFSVRDAKNRPYFHPASLNARDARAIVNLSAVLPGETLLDPFCGAGGLLIEAGLVGAKVVGVEIREDVAEGCRQNLRHFRVTGEIIVGDSTEIALPPADVVATDLPYGRSTYVPAQLEQLYRKAFQNIVDHMRGKYAVFVADRDVSHLLSSAGFLVERVIKWYVHKSLTRRVHLCLLQG